MKKQKNIKEILISLLIAATFILASTSVVWAGESGASDVQDVVKNIGEITPLGFNDATAIDLDEVETPSGPVELLEISQSPLQVCEVWISDINLLPAMPVDCYDLAIDLSKCAIGGGPCLIDCEVKAFLDIFRMDPIPNEKIICTDFEDVAEIYNNWDSVDDTTDSTSGPGGIDTFTWTDKRSHSPSHSFRCTQFDDHYLGNQLDYLTTSFENIEGYEEIEIQFWQWCEGELVDGGGAGDILEDYGYVECSLDGGPWTDWGEYYWDTEGEWELISLNITGVTTVSTIDVRFVWTTGPTIQNEGWYIDDVCFYGRKSPYEYHVFQTHTVGPVLIDDDTVSYTFPSEWCPEAGTYIVRVWLLDETGGECEVLNTQADPFIFDVEIGDVMDVAVIYNDYLGTSPFALDDDLLVDAQVTNEGTLDAINLPVTFSIKEQIITTHLDDFVEGDPAYDPYSDDAFTDGIWRAIDFDAPDRHGVWHIDDFDFVSPTQSWFCADGTDHYPAGMSDHMAMYWDPAGIDIADHVDDLSFDVTGMINYRLNSGDRLFSFCVIGSTWISFGWTSEFGIHPMYGDDTGGWQPFSMYDIYEDAYGVGGFFGKAEIYLAGYGDGTWDSFKGIGFMLDSAGRTGTVGEPGGSWSGVMLDNIQVKSVVAGEEIYKEILIIPELKAATPSDPADIEDLEFEWADMPTGNFVEEKSVPDDDDNDDNAMGAAFSVITDITCADPTEIESYDLTEDLVSNWHITTSGYNQYLWCGDETTGVYGASWDDVVLLAPGKDPSLDMSGLSVINLEFEDYGEIEGAPYDTGWFEINPHVSDPGYQWYQYDTTILADSFETGAPGWSQTFGVGGGAWMYWPYGTNPYGIEPLGSGAIFTGTEGNSFGGLIFDCEIFTPPMNLPGTSYDLSYETCYIAAGALAEQGIIAVYSGGTTPGDLEFVYDDYASWIPPGYYIQGTDGFNFDPSTFADPTQVYVGWYTGLFPSTGSLETFSIDDVSVFNTAEKTGYGFYPWTHRNFQLFPDNFINPYTGDTFTNEIGATFTDDMGFRFRFQSDSDYQYRGWLMDDIHLYGSDIFEEDPCDNMDNFLPDTIRAGDYWFEDIGYGGWTCQDTIAGLIPNDVNNPLVWDTSVPQAFYAELHFEHDYDLELNEDFCYLEFSTDGGSSWTAPIRYSGVGGGLVTIDMTAFIGENVLIRWRIDSDEATPSNYYSVKDMCITGMIDTVAPVTSGTLSGTMIHGWYSSPVTFAATATDDVSGVAAIYYSIDGGSTLTYSAPITISTNGEHYIEYWAVDNVGNEEVHHTTPTFKIDTGSAPSVAITAPGDGLYLFGNKLLSLSGKTIIIGGFTVEATASDSDSGVYRVTFALDGTTFGESTTAPYSAYCGEKHTGAGTISVTAEDFTGNTASASLSVTYFKFL